MNTNIHTVSYNSDIIRLYDNFLSDASGLRVWDTYYRALIDNVCASGDVFLFVLNTLSEPKVFFNS